MLLFCSQSAAVQPYTNNVVREGRMRAGFHCLLVYIMEHSICGCSMRRYKVTGGLYILSSIYTYQVPGIYFVRVPGT